jgi:protein transport protein SEC24
VPEFEAESMDEFNSDKSLMRMTTDRIPHTSSLAKDCSIPLAILVKPFGEMPSGDPIPTVSFNNKPIVRCRDCRAYINPFVKWTDNGQKWHCNFCKIDNTTENYYYCPTGADNIRKDFNERPELYSGSVDFLASNEYMNRPPMPPTFIFLFDVSQPAIDSGYLFQAASTIKGIIEEGTLPGGDRTRVCFLAYDKNLYFFNLRCTLKQPQMIVVPNADQAFLPQPDDLLVNLTESYDIIVNMLDNFHAFFHQSGSPSTQDTNFVPALNCATTVAKHIGGKIIMFQVSHAVSKSKYLALGNPAGKTDGPNEKFGTTN